MPLTAATLSARVDSMISNINQDISSIAEISTNEEELPQYVNAGLILLSEIQNGNLSEEDLAVSAIAFSDNLTNIAMLVKVGTIDPDNLDTAVTITVFNAVLSGMDIDLPTDIDQTISGIMHYANLSKIQLDIEGV